MLDIDTKRRIDTARDILVGKVPDPKSQVEQITIALIYKFMDDMDAESEEMGGKRKFFADDFARYGWAKLMRSGLGGFEILNLYAEAIAKMPENPGIPLLFRDIFKNAYLPYRDPETLRAFLKVIDEFEYDHSERLGDAFEYLLSVLGSQGDAGQFRTPRHIIDFIVEIVDPKKNETVLDPACGTAGFLISSYKHILKANLDSKGNSTLTPDERGSLAGNFKGYDISPDMVRLSLVNMYLHGFSDPHIYEYDTLTSLDRWNEYADVILANPPFMSPKGGIRPHNRFSVQSKRSEVLFVDYMAEHLTPNGRAGIIVPEGIIFQGGSAYVQLRKMLIENYLVAVISLPAGVFNPYAGVKTSILILDKSLAKKSKSIAFFKIENDGYDLGAQRRSVIQNDLPQVLAEIGQYMRLIMIDESMDEFKSRVGMIVEKMQIASKGDYNLSAERYRREAVRTSEYPFVRLAELCEINQNTVNPAETYSGLSFNYIDISCVENESGKFLGAKKVASNEAPSRARRSVNKGDVLISTVRPNLKAFTILNEVPERAIASTGFAVLHAKLEKLSPEFLVSMLRYKKSVDQMVAMMGKGSYPSINQSDVESIKIPLPPINIQKEIVTEIEGYQKVIDGAHLVVDNYRPHIPIHPDWPIVRIGDLVVINNGYVLTDFSESKNVACIKVSDMNLEENQREIITSSHWLESTNKSLVPVDSIVFPKRGAAIATNKKRITKIPCLIDNNCMALTVLPDAPLNARYLFNFLIGFDLSTISNSAGIALINNGDISAVNIPLPPIAVQEAIVAEIEAEQTLVNTNHELINRMEKKIQATLARVWGDDESPPAEA